MVKVKYLKKFKKYNMRVDNETIYLICKDDDVLERDIELKDKKMISDTIKLGKSINDTINSFYEKEINQIKEKFISYGINKDDVKDLKLHQDFINYNKEDLITTNNSIIRFIKESCYGCYKDLKDNTDNDVCDDENLSLKKINFFDYEIIDYSFFYNTYREVYNFFKDNGVSVEILESPLNIISLINWENYGIGTPKEIKKILPNEDQQTITTKKIKNYIRNQLDILLELLEKNKESISYTPIIEKINYIPLNIKSFFTYIMENNSNNEYTHKIYDKIINYINVYGVPFWTEDITIPKSIVDYSCIDIPLNSFLLICLSIYVYHELWNFFNKYYKKYDDFEGINFLNQALNILNIDYIYLDEKKDILDKLGESIKSLDVNINDKYNKIFGYKLKTYRDRVWSKKEKIFTVEYVYENYIIGVWDMFFMYYFGSDNSLTRIERHFCIECHQEFIGKGHKKNTMCDECYKIRCDEQNRKRVSRCRGKKRDK